ncbi:hypothetical protein [Variovorax sp. PDC80]|jgi:hypothetical protein|uniref:hypothetical protein n=1 Tax=unclassified Variovorax TaxID=663243 RepID=UPI0008E96AC1|nr:hypothetical protein [Variovorax sp. PDC80]SFO00210.1 hypothetical protein SAMN05443579_101233 [Variovorax sp. PDC80]
MLAPAPEREKDADEHLLCLEEHASTADDHAAHARHDARRREAERQAALCRAARATGASTGELERLARCLGEIDRCGRGATLVAEGQVAADRLSQRLQPLDLEDGHMAWQMAGAAEYIERGLTQALDPAHDHKWYARWQLWSFLLGGADAAHALALQGLALRPCGPRDPQADLTARARRILESWRRTSGPYFWSAMEDCVRQQGFSLETQAYLMHAVATLFDGDAMKLSNAECERLNELLVETYCDALGTSGAMPSAEIYRRMAAGLQAVDRETGRMRALGRSDAAQIAATAIYTLLRGDRSA